ncbi:MAG: NAD(P)H-dependent oxidoreductase [Coriobacteriales bacterium]|jgi:hypothetical protein|nr:NAD(P)H-dependent oxidoreductase [Coriobacteriales bacterium]
MHLVIINCSPRTASRSNTARIIEQFQVGYAKAGGTSELHHLSRRSSWGSIRAAFDNNNIIVFALPLYIESVPGIMLEFLETLSPKAHAEGVVATRIGFILQSGFPEASQLRCGEQLLEKLPGYLNCEYAGTLIKGNMFAASLLDSEAAETMLYPFATMGEEFARSNSFDKKKATEFAKPEYFSKGYILFFKALLGPVNRLATSIMAKRRGLQGSLKDKPYQSYID